MHFLLNLSMQDCILHIICVVCNFSVEKWTLSQNLTTYLETTNDAHDLSQFANAVLVKKKLNKYKLYVKCPCCQHLLQRTCFVQFEIRETCIYYCSSMDAFFELACSVLTCSHCFEFNEKCVKIIEKCFKNNVTYF